MIGGTRHPDYGAAGDTLEGLDLFRVFWLFQLGVVHHGWKTYGIEPWFTWKQIEDLLPLALAELARMNS